MAIAKSRRSRSEYASLPAAFLARWPEVGEGTELWNRLRETQSPSDKQRIIERYAPLVVNVAQKLIHRRPDYFGGKFDDMVGDGLVCLASFVAAKSEQSASLFHFAIARNIRRAMFVGEAKRSGFVDARRNKYPGDWIRTMRRDFVRSHGRMPNRSEIAAIYEAAVNNPQIEFRNPPSTFAISEIGDDVSMDAFASQIDPPARMLIDREVMRIAKKKLHGEDLKILKLVLNGYTVREIASLIGRDISRAHHRINGVLWQLRANVELAAYLGVQPAEKLPDGGERYWPSARELPPAKKVA